MFLPVILDFENNGQKFMLLKYLRFLDFCIEKNWAIITHEAFDKYELHFPNRNEYNPQMMQQYGYSLHSIEERRQIQQYFVPTEYYKKLEIRKGSKLESALYLLNERDEELESILDGFLQNILSNSGPIEAMLYFAACPLSLKNLADKYKIPMVAYETGPIRMPNYRCTTSYFCFNGLYDTYEITNRFQNFKKELKSFNVPLFSREELLTMFLSHTNLRYTSLIDMTPKYEIGIAGGCALVVPYFSLNKYMDHELIDDIFDIYQPTDILVRLHPGDMYTATYRLARYDTSKSPFGFLVNSKRVAAIGSNLLFEAMLWKRIPCSKAKVMPASILCSTDYTNDIESEDTEIFVNFFVLAFLVPNELALDEDYIRFRLANPSEKEIFDCHLAYYLKRFGLTEEWLSMDKASRLHMLQVYRNYSPMTEKELTENMLYTEAKSTSDLYEHYLQTKEYLDNILNSTTWKLTYPFRRMMDMIKGLK